MFHCRPESLSRVALQSSVDCDVRFAVNRFRLLCMPTAFLCTSACPFHKPCTVGILAPCVLHSTQVRGKAQNHFLHRIRLGALSLRRPAARSRSRCGYSKLLLRYAWPHVAGGRARRPELGRKRLAFLWGFCVLRPRRLRALGESLLATTVTGKLAGTVICWRPDTKRSGLQLVS